jgi:PhnB protein
MKHNLTVTIRVLCLLLIVGLGNFALSQKKDNSKINAKADVSNNKNEQMTTLSTFILFNGNCKQAMEFYKSCFGGELIQTSVGQSPMKNAFPESMHGKIVNARLAAKDVDISASDWLRPTQTPVKGNMVCLYLSGGTPTQLKALFDKLSEGADITDPLRTEPFGVYGALNDKFGIRWMFTTDQKE